MGINNKIHAITDGSQSDVSLNGMSASMVEKVPGSKLAEVIHTSSALETIDSSVCPSRLCNCNWDLSNDDGKKLHVIKVRPILISLIEYSHLIVRDACL